MVLMPLLLLLMFVPLGLWWHLLESKEGEEVRAVHREEENEEEEEGSEDEDEVIVRVFAAARECGGCRRGATCARIRPLPPVEREGEPSCIRPRPQQLPGSAS